jgi:hypothetical protein
MGRRKGECIFDIRSLNRVRAMSMTVSFQITILQPHWHMEDNAEELNKSDRLPVPHL